MPTPSVVEINGEKVSDVDLVEFVYATPTDSGYLKNVKPEFGTITLVRGATASPAVNLFTLATNSNGSRVTFGGKVTLVDDTGSDVYSVTFDDTFIEQWSVGQTESDPRGKETVVLRVGKLTFFAGAKSESVDFGNYPDSPDKTDKPAR